MADQVVARPTGPSRLERRFPIGAWLPKYDWGSSFAPNLIAAISVAALLIPESMGYASVAGCLPRSVCMPLPWPWKGAR
jgi:MFS superfamily sulfate permease-like transporter